MSLIDWIANGFSQSEEEQAQAEIQDCQDYHRGKMALTALLSGKSLIEAEKMVNNIKIVVDTHRQLRKNSDTLMHMDDKGDHIDIIL